MTADLILCAVSLAFILLGGKLVQKAAYLLLHGEKATAIIFKHTVKSDRKGNMYYPVIKFLTRDGKWIIQELSIGNNPPMGKGSEVEIIYDPENPTNVIINSTWRMVIIPRALLALGITGLVWGFMELLLITDFIN